MLCSISGNTPDEPVISIKSGYVYEKRLIEKYIEANGKEPVTGEPLNVNELVPVRVGKFVKPRPANATSIPSMLQLFQNEWDSLMLETFTLKQQYEQIRQELAHSIYQYDAACRVIARLIKERDQMKNEFMNSRYTNGNTSTSGSSSNTNDVTMEDANKTLPEEVQKKIAATSTVLIANRKKREKSPQGLPSVQDIKHYKEVVSLQPHQSKPIHCLDVSGDLIVSGGGDNSIQIYDASAKKSVASLANAHTKTINRVKFHSTQQDILFSCSADKTVKLWKQGNAGKFNQLYTFNEHRDSVTGISQHPSGDYLVSSSLDKSWNMYDIQTGKTLISVCDNRSKLSSYECVQIAPDGLILGLGTGDNKISIWEIASLKNAVVLEGHKSPVRSLSFSENGYYLAAADQTTIKLWDLRKCEVLQEIPFDASSSSAGHRLNSIQFDYSGNYLAAAGSDIHLFNIHGKTNPVHQIQTLSNHTQSVTDIAWAKNTSFFTTCSLDSTLKIWAKSQ